MWIKGDNPTQQRHFDYLEELRQSGITHMNGAAPYLQQAFRGLGRVEAISTLCEWILRHDQPEYILGKRKKKPKPEPKAKKRKGTVSNAKRSGS